jgi:hypothetical protein
MKLSRNIKKVFLGIVILFGAYLLFKYFSGFSEGAAGASENVPAGCTGKVNSVKSKAFTNCSGNCPTPSKYSWNQEANLVKSLKDPKGGITDKAQIIQCG